MFDAAERAGADVTQVGCGSLSRSVHICISVGGIFSGKVSELLFVDGK